MTLPQAADTNLRRPAGAVAGIGWMLVSCALLSLMAVIGRHAALAGVDPLQIVFLRLLFALVALMPVLAWRGPGMLRTPHLRVYLGRIVLGLIGMTAFFSALATMPAGEVTAIGFLMPLFSTVGAAIFLGETVRWRRWTATLTGFAGALVILRPGIAEFGPGVWLALIAAIAMAGASLLIKTLSDREDPDKVVLISLILQTPLSAIPAMMVWQWPEPWLWAEFAAMGLLAMLGHVALARAFAAADASLVMSIDFARLPFTVMFGFALFGELIDLWTWLGAAVIFGASAYNAHRERQLRRRAA